MDICKRDGNLVVVGGEDSNIKVYGKRNPVVVLTFEKIHSKKDGKSFL